MNKIILLSLPFFLGLTSFSYALPGEDEDVKRTAPPQQGGGSKTSGSTTGGQNAITVNKDVNCVVQ